MTTHTHTRTHTHTHRDIKDKRCRASEEILASKTQINYSNTSGIEKKKNVITRCPNIQFATQTRRKYRTLTYLEK